MALRWWDAKADDAVAWLFFQRRRHAALDEDEREFAHFIRSTTGDILVLVAMFLTAALCRPTPLSVADLAPICGALWIMWLRWTDAPPQRIGARVPATTMLGRAAGG